MEVTKIKKQNHDNEAPCRSILNRGLAQSSGERSPHPQLAVPGRHVDQGRLDRKTCLTLTYVPHVYVGVLSPGS